MSKQTSKRKKQITDPEDTPNVPAPVRQKPKAPKRRKVTDDFKYKPDDDSFGRRI